MGDDASWNWDGRPTRANFISRRQLAKEICLQVCKFVSPDREMVVYRCFKPFLHLLGTVNDEKHQAVPAAVIWALWAIWHVTGHALINNYRNKINNKPQNDFPAPDHGQNYKKMIRDEGVWELVLKIEKLYTVPEGCEGFKMNPIFTEAEQIKVRNKILELTQGIKNIVSGDYEADFKKKIDTEQREISPDVMVI